MWGPVGHWRDSASGGQALADRYKDAPASMRRRGVRRRLGGETGGDVARISVRVTVVRGGGLTPRQAQPPDFLVDWMPGGETRQRRRQGFGPRDRKPGSPSSEMTKAVCGGGFGLGEIREFGA